MNKRPLVFGFVSLFLFGGIFLLGNFGQKVEQWKTYRSEKYGFEIKYPSDFILLKSNDYGEYVEITNENLEVGIAGVVWEDEGENCIGRKEAKIIGTLKIREVILPLCKHEVRGAMVDYTVYSLAIPRGSEYQPPVRMNYIFIEAKARGLPQVRKESLDVFKEMLSTISFPS